MIVNTPAIVLSTIKYGEADLIARIYTKKLGTQSYMLKGIRKSRKGKLRVSLFQPLTQLEIQTQHKGKGSLEYIKEATTSFTYVNIPVDIAKSCVALFFGEVLSQLLTEQQPDEQLYDYLSTIFEYLDQTDHTANFTLKALLDMSELMGFGIDKSTIGFPYLNMLDGSFDNNGLQPHHLNQEESSLMKAFIGTKIDAIHTIKINRNQRTALLNLVLDYFKIHLHTFKKPNSLDILKQLFDS
ncbi:DNA replication and repair protein RecO [Nonlabens sp. Hel1_33_55]|uniref:DNA repair protein RecO n=1 Tax=Nonlabens sp. Hel1_33_55 TaxID=1336802 RepID=UPI000875E8E6|nr:DNA repair protein RecO [Nonlabens sp. Hel1_33_55]SCY28747.1 DNA replication and repair protein RecO [Nonlabens sp. Hel1_33_55]